MGAARGGGRLRREPGAAAARFLSRAHHRRRRPKPILDVLSHRAVRFAADCFGENAPETIEVLRAVLNAAPDADWAFRPLVVALTMTERWRDVLDAYDARLALPARLPTGAPTSLEEAARIAKDFIGDHGARDRLPRTAVCACVPRMGRSPRRSSGCSSGTSAGRSWSRSGASGSRCSPGGESARAAAAHRHHAAREARPARRGARRGAGAAARSARGRSARGAARAPARRRARDARDPPRRARRACGCATRRPAPARACPQLLLTAIEFAAGQRLRDLRRECGERLNALGDVAGALDQICGADRARPRRPHGRGRPAAARRGGARSRAGWPRGWRRRPRPAGARTPRRAAGPRRAGRRPAARRTARAARAALYEDAIGGRGRLARAAAREPSPPRGDLRRARRQGETAARPRAAGGGRAQAGGEEVHLGAGRRAGAGARRRRPGARRLARAARARSRRTSRRWRPRASCWSAWNAGRPSSTCCAGESRARRPRTRSAPT